MIIVSVSDWLKKEAEKSFLSKYEIVVNYGETSLIPLEKTNVSLKEELGITNKKVVLAVSSYWNDWKGKKYLYEVANRLPVNYVLLVVGGTFECDNYENIIHINNVLSKWGEIFGDNVLANAILDRLLHHSHVINIVVRSYRTKDIFDAKEEGDAGLSNA